MLELLVTNKTLLKVWPKTISEQQRIHIKPFPLYGTGVGYKALELENKMSLVEKMESGCETPLALTGDFIFKSPG